MRLLIFAIVFFVQIHLNFRPPFYVAKYELDRFSGKIYAGITQTDPWRGVPLSAAQLFPITREDILIHPGYDPRARMQTFFDYDLALVTLKNMFSFDTDNNVDVTPICIWPYDTLGPLPTGPNFKVSISGFGAIRTTMPKHQAPHPYFFENAGYVDNCKYIAMLLVTSLGTNSSMFSFL